MGESSRVVMSGRKKVDTWNAVPNQSRPQTQTRLIPNPMKPFEALACNECPSLTSQTEHFHEQGNGPVNCMYRSVPLIRPPILYTTSSLKWGEGLYSSMQVVSNISPPPQKKRSFTRSLHNGMPFEITMATSFRIESTVRGHHVYKASWSPYIGEELPVQCEVNNIHDDFAVAVLKNSNTVGYVPREISSLLVLPA